MPTMWLCDVVVGGVEVGVADGAHGPDLAALVVVVGWLWVVVLVDVEEGVVAAVVVEDEVDCKVGGFVVNNRVDALVVVHVVAVVGVVVRWKVFLVVECVDVVGGAVGVVEVEVPVDAGTVEG